MIPIAFVKAWSAKAPWSDMRQVEQDLIIGRALCDLFNGGGKQGAARARPEGRRERQSDVYSPR